MEDNKAMKIIDENGNEQVYRIICAFNLPETGKNYVVYTDDKKNKKGETEVYASIYYPDDDTKLDAVKTEEEWEAIEAVINSLQGGNLNE
jgi:uncharacterized protein YrzB (UPF0473 family)